MKNRLGLSFAFACGAFAAPAFAADDQMLLPEASAPYTNIPQWRASRLSNEKVAGNNERGGTPQANPLRAYPPSCGAGTLPDKPSGEIYSKDVTLLASKAGRAVPEVVKVVVWRIPCSSSGSATRYNPDGTPNGMTFVRIERSAELADQYFFLPVISAAQGTIEFGKPASFPRLVIEPNTLKSEILPGVSFNVSTTFVLDNSTFSGSGYFLFNKAFKLRVDPRNAYIQTQVVDIDIPAYAPAAGAGTPMPFDGYAAAQWTNNELGHGLITQVAEQYDPDGSMKRQLVYDVLLKDLEGNPFWLVGSTVFPLGTTSVTVDATYLDKDLAQKPWGSATFQMKDCGHLEVNYAPNADLAAPVPSFNGVIAYDRLFGANGMLCE